MAKNNIYLTMSNSVYRRYAKVPINIIAGLRPDPVDLRVQVGWTLSTAEQDYDLAARKRVNFVYENEVIEIYSEAEDKVFRRLNRSLLDSGLLREYIGEQSNEISDNFITDDAVLVLVSMKSNADFKKELQKFTSLVTLARIKERAEEIGVSIAKIRAIEARVQELS